tara:strand:+ start:26 stop:217 length:192 start_codon:yes stop_codon:yes gene_type:complete
MKLGDLVRWTKTGKLCVYLGLDASMGEGNEMYRFYSAEFGIVERWTKTLDPNFALEVVNEKHD